MITLDEGQDCKHEFKVLEKSGADVMKEREESDIECLRCHKKGHVMKNCNIPCRTCRQYCKTRAQCRRITNAQIYESGQISKKSFLKVSTSLQAKRSRLVCDYVKDANNFTNANEVGSRTGEDSGGDPSDYTDADSDDKMDTVVERRNFNGQLKRKKK